MDSSLGTGWGEGEDRCVGYSQGCGDGPGSGYGAGDGDLFGKGNGDGVDNISECINGTGWAFDYIEE